MGAPLRGGRCGASSPTTHKTGVSWWSCIDQRQHPAINNYLTALGRGEHPPWPMPPPPPPFPPTTAQHALPPSIPTTTPAATAAVAAAAADSGPRGSPPGLTPASSASLMSPDPARGATSDSATTAVEHRLQAMENRLVEMDQAIAGLCQGLLHLQSAILEPHTTLTRRSA